MATTEQAMTLEHEETARPPRAAGKRRLSLRAQGLVLHALGLGLIIAYGIFVIAQRGELHRHYTELDNKQRFEESLYRLSSALGRVDQDFDDAANLIEDGPHGPADLKKFDTIRQNLIGVLSDAHELLANFPEVRALLDTLPPRFDRLHAELTRARLADLSIHMHLAADQLDTLIGQISRKNRDLSDDYIGIYLGNTALSAVVSVLALSALGSLAIFFFSRLTSDIRKLSEAAKKIEQGDYVPMIEVRRKDELGDLMEAMNSMAARLKERERQLAISRQQYFHEQKMVAIGSLSAGVAHEIGNPISIITVLAEAVADAKRRHGDDVCCNCQPEMILGQIRRVSTITRDLSNLAAPTLPDLQLVDLNQLIRNACNFVRYDRRYGSLVDLRLELDSQIPAVRIVGDQFVQVMLNLLFNSADAFDASRAEQNRVTVSTHAAAGGIEVRVADNGSGMSEETLARAFDAFFTTKPEGKGTGLGLAVSRSLIEALGGTLTLESDLNVGTTVTIVVPYPKRKAA